MGNDQDLSQTLGELLEIKCKYINASSRDLLLRKVMEAQAKRSTCLRSWNQKKMTNNIQMIRAAGGQRHQMKIRRIPSRNNTLKIMKRRRLRRVGQEGSRRATTMAIERKVRTLKKLIPKGESTIGLDGLFKETAEYISNLQMRVRIMQAVVDAFSSSE